MSSWIVFFFRLTLSLSFQLSEKKSFCRFTCDPRTFWREPNFYQTIKTIRRRSWSTIVDQFHCEYSRSSFAHVNATAVVSNHNSVCAWVNVWWFYSVISERCEYETEGIVCVRESVHSHEKRAETNYCRSLTTCQFQCFGVDALQLLKYLHQMRSAPVQCDNSDICVHPIVNLRNWTEKKKKIPIERAQQREKNIFPVCTEEILINFTIFNLFKSRVEVAHTRNIIRRRHFAGYVKVKDRKQYGRGGLKWPRARARSCRVMRPVSE